MTNTFAVEAVTSIGVSGKFVVNLQSAVHIVVGEAVLRTGIIPR